MGRQYAYDAFGRRVAETYYVDGVSQTRYYVYDGDRVVEELDGDGNMTAGYVFGPYVDEVLAMRRDVDDNGTLETFYYLHDDQFNVIALTDAAGNVVERYEYGDFGDPTIYDAAGVEREDKTSAFGNVYMFQGRPYDAETGLYYFRTRYLDPVQGRFVSRDSIGVWGDANNLGNPYTFVGNNPWTNLDPYGLWAWDGDWIQYGVGGLLGLQGREVFAEGVSEMHTDAAKGVKGMVWTGPKNAVVGVATVVVHPIETMKGARDFAYAAYNDFGGTAAAIGDSIAAAATNPESIGAFTFDIMAGVATGGAAKASSAGSVGKLTNMVRRIDWADNRGMALNPFAKGALTKADDVKRVDTILYQKVDKEGNHLKFGFFVIFREKLDEFLRRNTRHLGNRRPSF